MDRVHVELPAEIFLDGSWRELPHEEIQEWAASAEAAVDGAGLRSEELVERIIARLGA